MGDRVAGGWKNRHLRDFGWLVGVVAMILALFGSPADAEGQEIRLSMGTASAPLSDLIGGGGVGIGLRYFGWPGLGFGIESDRFSRQHAVILACPTEECDAEPVDFDTTVNSTTLIALVGFTVGDAIVFRIGGGRSAGTVVSSAAGRITGQDPDVPDADLGKGLLAWSRGADGTVLLLELLYELPGPVPLSAFGSFRQHDLTMSGCDGTLTYFCGPLNHRELQIGFVAHLLPRWGPR